MSSALDAIGTDLSAGVRADERSGLESLSSKDFVQLILTELSNQDPLAPNDTQALLDQLSTVYNIQSSVDLSSSMKSLVDRNELSSASGMIGKYITGLSEESRRVEGLVAAVSRTSDGTTLLLDDGSRVPMAGVDGIIEAPAKHAAASGEGGGVGAGGSEASG